MVRVVCLCLRVCDLCVARLCTHVYVQAFMHGKGEGGEGEGESEGESELGTGMRLCPSLCMRRISVSPTQRLLVCMRLCVQLFGCLIGWSVAVYASHPLLELLGL